jgi:NADP-dependent 3-hydroxy acid dehydrogenase YdfG
MSRMAKKSVMVTGASSGIGKAIALASAQEGASVALVARNRDALNQVADEIHDGGGQAIVCPADVADEAQVLDAVQKALQQIGPIDVLVNNAGMNITERSIQDTTSDQWRRLLAVNLTSAFLFTKALLPDMKERRQGTIINLASRAALLPDLAGGVGYSTSKMGMDALTQVTNEEANRYNVRACLLCPGTTNTPIVDKRPTPPSQEERDLMLQPEDVAEVALMVASLPLRVKIELVSMVQTTQ